MRGSIIRYELKQFSRSVKGHGRVVQGDRATSRAYSSLVTGVKKIPLGGDERVVLDCRGVNIVAPSLLSFITSRIEYEETRERRLCYHRSLVIMDPNEDTKLLLTWMFKKTPCSLFIIYTEEQRVVREDILHLPYSLREALDIIVQRSSLSSQELIELLKDENPTNVRERLRQLFKRGLVKRQAHGTVDGKRFFIYEPFTLLGLDFED